MAAARALWRTDESDAWSRALATYPSVVADQGVAGLAELDGWYRAELPALLAERTPVEITRSELVDVVRWKMRRGEWRARNLGLAESNAEAVVRGASARAFAAVADPRRALAALQELAGVGPATASAVLAAYRPERYPFLDELVGAAIPDLGPARFTPAYYARYAVALRDRATGLGAGWTAQAVGLALWSAAGGKQGSPMPPNRTR